VEISYGAKNFICLWILTKGSEGASRSALGGAFFCLYCTIIGMRFPGVVTLLRKLLGGSATQIVSN
jgi:hypothetical protein